MGCGRIKENLAVVKARALHGEHIGIITIFINTPLQNKY